MRGQKTAQKLLFLFFAALPFAICFSCKHTADVPEQQVSFTNDISPILLSSCAQPHCHDATGTEAAPLANRTDVLNYIKPGDPRGSLLYQTLVTHSADKVMPPPSSPQLTDVQIQLIYVWILQGAKDN